MLKQLTEDKCELIEEREGKERRFSLVIVKATNGPRYVVGCRRQLNKAKLRPGTRVALDMTTLTVMRYRWTDHCRRSSSWNLFQLSPTRGGSIGLQHVSRRSWKRLLRWSGGLEWTDTWITWGKSSLSEIRSKTSVAANNLGRRVALDQPGTISTCWYHASERLSSLRSTR